MAILALGVLLAAFLLGLVLGSPYIGLLRRLRIGQNIRPEGPETHYVKQGIPTMGGALFIGVTSALWLLVLIALPEDQRDLFIPQTIVPVGTLLAVGVLGAIDDFVNVRYGAGIRGRHKLVWQTIVGLAAAIYIQRHFGVTGIYVPLVGEIEIGAFLFIALALFSIVAMSNAVNLTDGMDGLAGGLAVFAFLSIAFIAAAREFPWLVVLSASLVGALLAYLWFNVHPAEVIMGDTGALALGATLAVVALTTGFVLLLPLLGVVFVAETVAVILQVGSYKLRGRRIFRMSPLHNHFELIGWAEEKVTIRFWLIGALAGIVAAILAFVTPK
ncbi:MAG: phospho-N-acetylmuramoyl-pentapeptide-transferase [Chloroflexi bacterium]|nr:MAG: phospho-N-acetylmuramoyl-pentapeptide-transferase [Chloroflexota bacterium]TMB97278.1 MAG: phospho-N-acetylmuramoyl-pentapeptide-transferase [Chloroflexota bacterium]TMC30232.1 MAG: phospho-N-acetylmuramoyl-pentapeptide-transferase [Chloroflexota bacterium]TMC33376.1 MAG: phospho-N-acetylmuramoyl-pentapeptide-transferase [Chloroflexota bacterium]TMC56086.1 MAG: phospho-N-acetylmuramoyl-pentapeptide-transferase [Chloroflexota bacterium]